MNLNINSIPVCMLLTCILITKASSPVGALVKVKQPQSCCKLRSFYQIKITITSSMLPEYMEWMFDSEARKL